MAMTVSSEALRLNGSRGDGGLASRGLLKTNPPAHGHDRTRLGFASQADCGDTSWFWTLAEGDVQEVETAAPALQCQVQTVAGNWETITVLLSLSARCRLEAMSELEIAASVEIVLLLGRRFNLEIFEIRRPRFTFVEPSRLRARR